MSSRSFWKSEREFDIAVLIARPVEVVRGLLAEPLAWVGLQPLVTAVIKEPDRPGFFTISERLTFAGVPMNNRYRARISPHHDGVDSEAWSAPAIHLQNRLRWVAEGAATRLSENVRIEAPWPFMSYVVRTARSAHLAMLERIRDAAERRG